MSVSWFLLSFLLEIPPHFYPRKCSPFFFYFSMLPILKFLQFSLLQEVFSHLYASTFFFTTLGINSFLPDFYTQPCFPGVPRFLALKDPHPRKPFNSGVLLSVGGLSSSIHHEIGVLVMVGNVPDSCFLVLCKYLSM